ncbi:MAG: transcription antitermination factor NusB [Lachnospiraceae bacterium]|nr:transcription antitermination factor NusB [Lachnospiraceae bacterium]
MDNNNVSVVPEQEELRTRITAHELRRHTFVTLFLTGFHENAEREEMARRYLSDLPYVPEVQDRIYARYRQVAEKIGRIDPMIGKSSHGWNLRRIGKVELNLMRIAVFEIYFDEEIPREVAIDEAVELGKRYGGENSPAFINGILSEVMRNYPPESVTDEAK